MPLDRLREDINAIFAKDPAARTKLEVLTSYPGLHAIWIHRLAHWFWRHNRFTLARFTSHISRFLTGIEIHPGAQIGRRFFIDHGMGIVIGETAEIGDDVLMYKGVVLGGTSAERGKRHHTIENGAIIGSNAVILGPVTIGACARIGSGAVVIRSVPMDSTAVGVPARVVRGPHMDDPEHPDLQHNKLPDPIAQAFADLNKRVAQLESELTHLRAMTDESRQSAPDSDIAMNQSE